MIGDYCHRALISKKLKSFPDINNLTVLTVFSNSRGRISLVVSEVIVNDDIQMVHVYLIDLKLWIFISIGCILFINI